MNHAHPKSGWPLAFATLALLAVIQLFNTFSTNASFISPNLSNSVLSLVAGYSSTAISYAVVVHVAFFTLSLLPFRSPLVGAATVGLAIASAIFCTIPILVNYQLAELGFRVGAIQIFSSVVQIFVCFAILFFVSPAIGFGLVDSNATIERTQQSLPASWSISSLMVITAIIAGIVAVAQLIDWNGFDHWYVIGKIILGCNFVFVTYLAAYLSVRKHKIAVVAMGLLAPLFFGTLYFAMIYIREPSAFQGSMVSRIGIHVLVSIAVLAIQLWFFRCWKMLGYIPVIQVRGKGLHSPGGEIAG